MTFPIFRQSLLYRSLFFFGISLLVAAPASARADEVRITDAAGVLLSAATLPTRGAATVAVLVDSSGAPAQVFISLVPSDGGRAVKAEAQAGRVLFGNVVSGAYRLQVEPPSVKISSVKVLGAGQAAVETSSTKEVVAGGGAIAAAAAGIAVLGGAAGGSDLSVSSVTVGSDNGAAGGAAGNPGGAGAAGGISAAAGGESRIATRVQSGGISPAPPVGSISPPPGSNNTVNNPPPGGITGPNGPTPGNDQPSGDTPIPPPPGNPPPLSGS